MTEDLMIFLLISLGLIIIIIILFIFSCIQISSKCSKEEE